MESKGNTSVPYDWGQEGVETPTGNHNSSSSHQSQISTSNLLCVEFRLTGTMSDSRMALGVNVYSAPSLFKNGVDDETRRCRAAKSTPPTIAPSPARNRTANNVIMVLLLSCQNLCFEAFAP